MYKYQVLNKIHNEGLVAIIRTNTCDEAIRTAEACLEGGITCLEVTFTVPKADKIIEELKDRYEKEAILLGAGSVLDPETARTAMLSGAEFIVCPHTNAKTMEICNRYGILCIPGAMTVKEIVEAMEKGAEMVKVFPARELGKSFIKAVKGPLPQALIMPTGGISPENAKEWLEAGGDALGMGGSLMDGVRTGDYKKVTETASAVRKTVQDFKNGK